MTVFKHPRGTTWRYDFWFKGQRYTGTTGQLTKADALAVEGDVMKRVRQKVFGIAPFDRMETPSFSAWADLHYQHVKQRGSVVHLDQLENNLRHVLMFFGRRPPRPRDLSARVDPTTRAKIAAREASAPYHDLRLVDPILDPEWIEKFEGWMSSLGLSGARKNHLRSAASGLYRTALRPGFRKRSGIASNPFLNIDRDTVGSRDRTLTPRQLWAWIAASLPHARVAMAIAAYAPKLREGVILNLEWQAHLDADLTRITVQRHKARRWKNRAQVALIPDDLRAILQWWRTQHPNATHVIWFEGEPVSSIAKGLRASLTRANKTLAKNERLTYGIKDGVTFHTIRHTMATMLAELGVPEKLREAVMDQTQQTIAGYSHLRPRHEHAPVRRLASRLKLVGAVQGTVQGPTARTRAKPQQTAHVGATARKRREQR